MKWYEWVFGGIGLTSLSAVAWIFRRIFIRTSPPAAPIQARAATGDGSPVAVGNHITQQVTQHYSPSDTSSDKRHEEWQELIQELPEILDQMSFAFGSIKGSGIIDVDAKDPWIAIRRGNRLVSSRLYIADVFKNSGLLDKWNELVKGAEAGDFPRAPSEMGYSSISRYVRKRHAFENELTRVAREDLKK